MRLAVGLGLLAALFAGCASAPPPSGDRAILWQKRQAELKTVSGWRLHGRLALRAADQGWHATVDWERDGDRHRLDFTGPLGRGHMRLIQDRNGAEVTDSERHSYRDADAQRLLRRVTGWQFPLEGLNYWVLGLPVPGQGAPAEELDAYGRLKNLAQSGWDIQFLDYARYDGLELPTKMFIKGENRAPLNTQGDDTLEVRLVIERWAFQK